MYKVVVSTDNGLSMQLASDPKHVAIFLEQALNEPNHGRVLIVVEERK